MSNQLPGAPYSGQTSLIGAQQISFYWQAPMDTGSAPITTYELKVTPEQGSVQTFTIEAPMTSYTVNNLAENVSVQGSVRASNDGGATYGPEMMFESVKPIVAPTATVTNVVAKVSSPGIVTVTWEGVTIDPSVRSYYLVTSKSSKTTDPTIGFATRDLIQNHCEINGLNVTSTYTFTVCVVNNAGQGPTASSGLIKF
jgi:hypothetical protein